jgi:hypothetical protein
MVLAHTGDSTVTPSCLQAPRHNGFSGRNQSELDQERQLETRTSSKTHQRYTIWVEYGHPSFGSPWSAIRKVISSVLDLLPLAHGETVDGQLAARVGSSSRHVSRALLIDCYLDGHSHHSW